jgi:isopentenyldiphosphate isomerase
MTQDKQDLNIVDDLGHIIGVASREQIHREGLLHREINVWFYSSKGEVVFQHRSPSKDTFPDMLDATCGGHVDIGMDWLDTAVKELDEETGLRVLPKDLTFIRQIHFEAVDNSTSRRNNALQNIYAYRYEGALSELRVEDGMSVGFEAWKFSDLYDLTPEQAKRFTFSALGNWYLDIFRQIERLQLQEEIQ